MDSDSFGHLQTAEALTPTVVKYRQLLFEVTVNSGETVQLNAPVVRNQQTVISKEYIRQKVKLIGQQMIKQNIILVN